MIPASRALLKVRTQGVLLTQPLKPLVDALEIRDSETYLDADLLLGRVRNARAVWKNKIEPITSPLQRALDNAKEAMVGAKALNAEVDGPLETLELGVKGKMKTFKLLEARQLQEARDAEARESLRLRTEAAEAARKEEAAKTAPMKAKLAQKRAELEAQAEEVELAAEDIRPIMGASSSSRTTTKCRIAKLEDFLLALEDYEPKAGIYKEEHPPLSLLRDPGVQKAIQVAINRIFSTQPGVVKTWGGIEIYDDVTISGR